MQMNPVQHKCLINGKEQLIHVNKMKKDLSQGDKNPNIMHQDDNEENNEENTNYYNNDNFFEEDEQDQEADNEDTQHET